MVTLSPSREDRAKPRQAPAIPSGDGLQGTSAAYTQSSRSLIGFGLTTRCVARGATGLGWGGGCCGFLRATDIAPGAEVLEQKHTVAGLQEPTGILRFQTSW